MSRDTPEPDLPRPILSFVIPCLDEAAALPQVLRDIRAAERQIDGYRVEIVVADNGSVDGSRKIAAELGARVVDCPVRGYGAALQCGIEAAAGEVIVFADGDGTYDFRETPRLLAELHAGHDLVLGSRLEGSIEPGAMPWLHRHLGTPVLTWLINRLFATGGQRVSDCNSGFRCLRKKAFSGWQVRSQGMEFASQMLVRALQAGASIGEVPITLRADSPARTPHLATWRDGMRHLLQVLSESPGFFFHVGVAVLALSWGVLLVGFRWGPVDFGGFALFGLHTMMFALVATCLGMNVFGIGLLLATRRPATETAYDRLLSIDEGRLLWGGIGLLAFLLAATFLPIWVSWWRAGFHDLALEKATLVWTAFGADGVFFVFNLIAAHMLKRG